MLNNLNGEILFFLFGKTTRYNFLIIICNFVEYFSFFQSPYLEFFLHSETIWYSNNLLQYQRIFLQKFYFYVAFAISCFVLYLNAFIELFGIFQVLVRTSYASNSIRYAPSAEAANNVRGRR